MAGLGKYSFGTGDRFGKEGVAQLRALIKLQKQGVKVSPVWNKSNREHLTVNSTPESVRTEADAAVKALNYDDDYFVDADHINRDNVKNYLACSNFFTIDVAQYIGKKSPDAEMKKFEEFFKKYRTVFNISGIKHPIEITDDDFKTMAINFLHAMQKASEVYFFIESNKQDTFFTEVSIDEVDNPQSPVELFFILAALTYYQVPVTTIAPKFTGNFYKGIDYEGDLKQFEKEFEEDLHVLSFAIDEFKLPKALKLSVHSGSDKFSIYPIIHKLIKKHDTGLHLKTAGTTWLEEAIGLAESGGEAFKFVQHIYAEALDRFEELTEDYAEVLSIDRKKLPSPKTFTTGSNFASALRHDRNDNNYNPHFRQLMHCAYKLAAEQKELFSSLLSEHREVIAKNVTDNLYRKHLKPLFLEN